jgi:MFS family permease
MVWLVALVAFVHRSGTMVLPFLALYLTSQKGLTAREAGGILSLYGVGSIGGSYLGGWLSDRIGSIHTQQASLCAAAIAFVSLSMMPTPFRIAVLVVLLSLVAESFRPANAATLAEMSPPELQVRAFSLRRMGTNLGMAIGPAVGGVLVVYSYTVLFFVEAGVCLLTAGLLWALFRDHIRDHRRDHPLSSSAQRHVDDADDADDAAHEIESPGSRSAWRDRIFLTLAGLTMLLITVLAQLFGTYPLTISEVYHLPEYTIGLVFTLNTLVIVVFQMVVIRMVERFDTLRVVGVGAFFLCAGFSLLQCTSSIVLIGVTVLVWTLGEMLTTPLLEGFVAERSSVENRGQYMGVFSAAFSGAFVLAPLGGTWVYEVFGYQTLWWTCGVMGVGLWIGFSWLNTKVQQERLR